MSRFQKLKFLYLICTAVLQKVALSAWFSRVYIIAYSCMARVTELKSRENVKTIGNIAGLYAVQRLRSQENSISPKPAEIYTIVTSAIPPIRNLSKYSIHDLRNAAIYPNITSAIPQIRSLSEYSIHGLRNAGFGGI